jgi:hypothetical protein
MPHFEKRFMTYGICSCKCDGIHVANIFEYLDPQITVNRVALISIGTNDSELRIVLENFTEIYHPRFVGEISAILQQESLYSLLESRLFVRRDISDVREKMRMATSGNTLADLQ